MRVRRILLLVGVAAAAVVVVPKANALAFDDSVCPIQAGGILRICPSGTVGTRYSLQLFGRAGTGCVPYVAFTSLSGDFPAGLTLSSTGLISGTPTANGTYLSWISMYDIPAWSGGVYWCADAKSTERQFSITIGGASAPAPTPLRIEQSSLNPTVGVVNTAYRFQFTASAVGTQMWTVKSGSLPAGLTLSSSGLLSGTPTATGTFSFDVQVSDGSRSDSHSYTLVLVTPLTISPVPALPAAEVGEPFHLQLAATGGQASYRWSSAVGQSLPPGLALDADTGIVNGQPTSDGSFPLAVTVKDSLGLTDTINVVLPVAAKLATDQRVFAPRLGQFFHSYLLASGGIAPTPWEITRGKLPLGIHLVRGTGELVGKPLRARTAIVLVRVTDALGAVAEAKVVLTVVP